MTSHADPLNILIIEDEAILVMDMESVIEDSGHRVIGDVASVPELQNLKATAHPDITFVDIQLANNSNGLDASTLVRERWNDTAIVFVTANPGKIPVGHAGAFGIIAKPFTRDGLLAALEYLSEGLRAPPPRKSQPSGFVAFPDLEKRWGSTQS
jgi:AmiR/NasT family two-component response regulator